MLNRKIPDYPIASHPPVQKSTESVNKPLLSIGYMYTSYKDTVLNPRHVRRCSYGTGHLRSVFTRESKLPCSHSPAIHRARNLVIYSPSLKNNRPSYVIYYLVVVRTCRVLKLVTNSLEELPSLVLSPAVVRTDNHR